MSRDPVSSRAEGAPVPSGAAQDAGPPATSSNGLREVLFAVPVLARAAWFALGALSATAVVLLVLLAPGARGRHASESAPPFEGFPFADNAGVCQEYVALASTLRTSHADAQRIAQRIAPALPPTIRADNLRVVRAFAPGEVWTIAVDAQSGTGDMARATAVAAELNAIAGTGVRFEPVFYSSRRLYDEARVLCMPRQQGAGDAGPPPAR